MLPVHRHHRHRLSAGIASGLLTIAASIAAAGPAAAAPVTGVPTIQGLASSSAQISVTVEGSGCTESNAYQLQVISPALTKTYNTTAGTGPGVYTYAATGLVNGQTVTVRAACRQTVAPVTQGQWSANSVPIVVGSGTVWSLQQPPAQPIGQPVNVTLPDGPLTVGLDAEQWLYLSFALALVVFFVSAKFVGGFRK